MTVDLLGLFFEANAGSWIVLLGDPGESQRLLPIFIGPAEAQSIAIGMGGERLPRPGTHDLAIDLIEALEGSLDRVTITDLVEGTFIAQLSVDTLVGTRTVSARPSDGIALAVRSGAPVLVEATVLDEAGVSIEREPNEPLDEQQIEQIVAEFSDFLETTQPEDFSAADDEPGSHGDDDDPGLPNEDQER